MKTNKIYNVFYETHYEDEDTEYSIISFKNKDDAKNCLENILEDEIRDGDYTDEMLEECLEKRADNEYFTFYTDSSHGNIKFRGQILENILN